MSSSRQLAAIMFTDIVGYTAMMGEDERKAFALLKQNRHLQKPLIDTYGGRWIKELGDGTLASFPTVIDAVSCACMIIKGSEAINGLQLRIGIHLGDVVFENDDVFGDSVNIASRLQALAPIGAIWISESVHKNISNKKGITSRFVREEALKNVKEPMHIYEVDIDSFHQEAVEHIEQKPTIQPRALPLKEKKKNFNSKKIIVWSVPAFALGVLFLLVITPLFKKQHARNQLLPAIQKQVNENFRPPTSAFDMAIRAEKYIATDTALIKLWPKISTTISIETEPAGAEVLWKDYHAPDAEWRSAGITPLKDVRFPRIYLRMEFRKQGFQTIEYAGPMTYKKLGSDIHHLKLDTVGRLPENMIRIPKDTTDMYIVGLEQHGPKAVGEFLIDRYEVTNLRYKAFMDAGGYANPSYWTYPIYADGKEITPASALVLFKDHTGRQGPATWEAGTYPDGLENHPVTGISWYEAAAYASYAGKELPTVFHWAVVAATSRTEFIVPLSNYNGKSTLPVGSQPGYSTFGIYDLAGNAREWCFNASGKEGHQYILGGGYTDPSYSFNDAYHQMAIDRSITNGFRCIRTLPDDTISGLIKPATMTFRDYRKEKPVDEKTFNIFLSQYAYDKTPLHEKIETTLEREFWTVEKITFDAAYNKERMEAYLYLPKGSKAPFQTVLFFPGSGDIYSRKFDPDNINGRIDFILKSGRALVWPIYKGTHERHDELKSDLQEETVFYKDHVIMWRKDIGRTLDYLETRMDIQSDKIAYLGWSWGGFMGGLIPAVEKRIKVVVLNVGGLGMTKTLPEVDPFHFLPHITQPVLMLNGKHDMFFPLETSQKPMFDLLGTAKEDKLIKIYESGHLVPRSEFVKETLFWFDKYLGPVK